MVVKFSVISYVKILRWPVFIYCVVSTWVRYGSDSRIRYGSGLIVFHYYLILWYVLCDLYFHSHILLVLIMFLILIIHINYIVCIVYM